MIYLDNHTTAKPSKAAVAAMTPFLEEKWGVPSAPHKMGQELLSEMSEAYLPIYQLLGAREPDTFVFTSSGTEAVNQVIWSAYVDWGKDGRNHFITSSVDEAATILSFERLEELGCEYTMVPVNEAGVLTADALSDAITPRTCLVSIAWGNALTGTIQPVAELAEVCRERGIWFHIDATHVLGKIPFDLDEIAPDFLTFNGDQLHAPKGTGGLLVRSGLHPRSLIAGSQEQDGLRAGSFSVALLAALGVAAGEALEPSLELPRLRHRFEEGLKGEILFGDRERLPGTTAVAFPGVSSDALLFLLNRRGVLTSFGGGAFQTLTHQLDHPLKECAVTFTLSRFTTEGEIDRAVAIINEAAGELQRLSQDLWRGAWAVQH